MPVTETGMLKDQVRAARAVAGITQEELAKMVGRRQATISDIEHGKKEVGLSTLVLIAAALEKPISYFRGRLLRHKTPRSDTKS